MARNQPPLKALHELTTSDQLVDCFALLAEKKRGLASNGKHYLLCRFRDNRRTVTAMIWGDTDLFEFLEDDFPEGHFYKLRGAYTEHERYGPQFEITQIRPVNETDQKQGFDSSQLVETSRFDPDDMMTELCHLVKDNVSDEPLCRLILSLLHEHSEPLKRLPATQIKFHPFVGGLLEHILSVTKNCLYLVDRYSEYYEELEPPLNRDLVIAGAVLHDIGRVREFSDDPLATQVTVEGHLLGHLFLGRDIVREAALKQDDVHPELLQMLEHLIITHLKLPEWGSPRLPCIPECLILHHADDLDAKMEMYVRCLSRDTAPGPMTDRDPILNRQLYKDREL